MNYLTNKYELSKYLIERYYEQYGDIIHKYVLQGALYLLYGNYAMYRNIDQKNKDRIEEYGPFPKELFKPNFMMKGFGPVDRDLFYDYRSGISATGMPINFKDIMYVENDFLEHVVTSLADEAISLSSTVLYSAINQDANGNLNYNENELIESNVIKEIYKSKL